MIVLGIVGSPAGGKSTVAARLQELGATWINADLVAREVLERPETQARLIEHFGTSITDNVGRIDRSKLAARVFGADDSSRAALEYLEGLVHPETRLVIDRSLRQLARANQPATILDVPLLFESRWDRACDEIWCVDAGFEQRLMRAQGRGWDEDELRRRESNQMPIQEKRDRCTLVIDNHDSLDVLIEQVDRRYRELLAKTATNIPPTNHCTGN